MATRPRKVQKVTDQGLHASSSENSPAAAVQTILQDSSVLVPGKELWQQQRLEWVGNSTSSPRPPGRPVISPDSTYDTLLLTSRPFVNRIPLAEMVDFLQEAWADEGLYE